MNIGLFFTPISESFFEQHENTLGGKVDAFTEVVPDWRSADIVIFGVPEYRGAGEQNNDRNDLEKIRNALYRQKSNIGNLRITDIGDLKEGIELEDTNLRLQETISSLIQENCLPIILGGSHDLTYGQYLGYVALELSLIHI